MSNAQAILAVATLLGAVGLWLLLPRGGAAGRALGGTLTLIAAGCWGSQLPGVGNLVGDSLFTIIAGITLFSSVCAVTFRSPVYCAIWFGLTLIGTAGLFLMQGAEFLAVATVVVYAGAILVTFLFVLMLSEPDGHTVYDRRSSEALISAATGAVIVGILSMSFSNVMIADAPKGSGKSPAIQAGLQKRGPTGDQISADYPIAQLGAELFSRQLVAVEAAGVLLFAAIVGAAVIVSQGRMRHGRHAPAADDDRRHSYAT
jgi:NADH-quinone oxidoreductase subunit J